MVKSKTSDKKNTKYKNLFEKPRKIDRRFGQGVQPKRDLSRFVKWPRYILLQRKKKILYKRLNVPAVINQFSFPLSSNQ